MERCENPQNGLNAINAPSPMEGVRVDVELPPSTRTPAYVRTLVGDKLHEWLLTCLRDDALVVANELVTNALVHAPYGYYRFVMVRESDGVRIEMHDCIPVHPARVLASSKQEHGRGMWLIAALSSENGSDETPSGKSVWAVLRSPNQKSDPL
jgi:hypothetical protein